MNESGWLAEETVAASELRQGKAPSLLKMITGVALIELARPRRSKVLPRHFVLAVTADRVVAFKATSYSSEGGTDHRIRVKSGEVGSWPRSSVSLGDLPEGKESRGGMLTIDGETFPVSRSYLSGDSGTDELFEVLSRRDTGRR